MAKDYNYPSYDAGGRVKKYEEGGKVDKDPVDISPDSLKRYAKTYQKYSNVGMKLDSLKRDKVEKLKKIPKDLSSDKKKIRRKDIMKEYTKNRNKVIDKHNKRKK